VTGGTDFPPACTVRHGIEQKMRISHHHLTVSLAAFALAAAVPTFGPRAAQAADSSGVTVADNGAAFVMDNGLSRITIAKKGGLLTHIAENVDGKWIELADPKRAMYFDMNAGAKDLPADVAAKAPKAGYQWANTKSTDIVRNTPDLGEVVMTGVPGTYSPFSVDLHYIMVRGLSGYYAYAQFHHDASMPAGGVGQTRFVVVGGDLITDHIVDDARKGPVDRSPAVKTVSDATYLQQDGNVYCKYNNTCYLQDHYLHGMAGHGVGVWMVTPSNEYVNGGPTKQELTVHAGNSLLSMFIGGHYGASGADVDAGEEWTKVFGPVLVYLNKGATTDDMYADAKRQTAVERSEWPYNWVNNPAYAVSRGTVSGTLKLTDGAPTRGAMVVLAAAGGDWPMQAKGYQYWSGVGEAGQFAIPKVSPGQYSLYAYGANQFEQFEADNVTVAAGQTTALGTLDWKPVKHGQTIWQIGIPDRKTTEYKGGEDNWGPNGMRHWANFLRYPKDFPNDVSFTIGQSHEATDWNFAQWTSYSKNKYWRILFTLPKAATGTATLTLGIAASDPVNGHTTHTRIIVNGTAVGELHLPKSGAAAYRSGGSDSPYRVEYVTFDASLLKPGANVVELGDEKATPFPPITDPASPIPPSDLGAIGAVMYDAIRLEIGQ
jgi:rhamnogalacturonan endolyase